MHFISGVWRWAVLSGCLRDCGGLRRCSTADVNSAWSLDLLQTGRQSLSSLQPTSLSATLAFTKSIMFSLLCTVPLLTPWGVVDLSVLSALISLLEWSLQSTQSRESIRKQKNKTKHLRLTQVAF